MFKRDFSLYLQSNLQWTIKIAPNHLFLKLTMHLQHYKGRLEKVSGKKHEAIVSSVLSFCVGGWEGSVWLCHNWNLFIKTEREKG